MGRQQQLQQLQREISIQTAAPVVSLNSSQINSARVAVSNIVCRFLQTIGIPIRRHSSCNCSCNGDTRYMSVIQIASWSPSCIPKLTW